jgi:MraZ protein
MFRGNSPTRVDEKGRLKVPADHKRVLDEKYSSTKFYITSLDGKVAQIYPMEEWERIEQKLAALPTFNSTKQKFLDRTNYYGQVVEMDGQGRLLIPGLLRESANILGKLSLLEVRNMEEFKKTMEAEPFTPEDAETLGQLGI